MSNTGKIVIAVVFFPVTLYLLAGVVLLYILYLISMLTCSINNSLLDYLDSDRKRREGITYHKGGIVGTVLFPLVIVFGLLLEALTIVGCLFLCVGVIWRVISEALGGLN